MTMLRRLLFLVVVVGLLPPTRAQDETLTVATYNVANYTLTDRQVDGSWLPNYPKPDEEKAALRRVIHRLDADLLALQEIGGPEFLEELRRDLADEGLDYPHAVVLHASDDQRRLAVLSRWPLLRVAEHTRLLFRYQDDMMAVKRGLLEVAVETPIGEITCYNVHLKSRLTTNRADPESRERRGKEATAARNQILERFPPPDSGRFIILGDFNEGPLGRPLRAFTRIGDWRISEPVTATDSRGETWTHHYRRGDVYSRIDYVLVSPSLVPRVPEAGAVILDGPDVRTASDHRPVVVTLDVSVARN